ncbi:MAG: hypothetical protein K9G12_07310 [Candidatus Nanopelagicales bacterium]|nr:hypothetical protein [Candidatus Nanopelagicales bacterium]
MRGSAPSSVNVFGSVGVATGASVAVSDGVSVGVSRFSNGVDRGYSSVNEAGGDPASGNLS